MNGHAVAQRLVLEDIINNSRWQLLILIGEGASDTGIADSFDISKKAAQKRIQRLMRDLRLKNRADLVKVFQACDFLANTLDRESTVPGDLWAALVAKMGDRKARILVGCMTFMGMLPEPTRAMVLERLREVTDPPASEQPTPSDHALDSVPTEAPTEGARTQPDMTDIDLLGLRDMHGEITGLTASGDFIIGPERKRDATA